MQHHCTRDIREPMHTSKFRLHLYAKHLFHGRIDVGFGSEHTIHPDLAASDVQHGAVWPRNASAPQDTQ